MFKRKIALCCFIIICIILGGCSDALKDENVKLKGEISLKDNKIAEMEKKIAEINNEADLLKNKLKEKEFQYTYINEKLSKNKDNFYAIYTANTYTMDKEVFFWIYIPGPLSIKQRLDVLANALSQSSFNNLPISVIKIEETQGKRIAVINLMESKENQGVANASLFKGYSWAQVYFQGSTGGSVTSTSLVETFLQREYDGDWIDGVRFLYSNGSAWTDHTQALDEINYRME